MKLRRILSACLIVVAGGALAIACGEADIGEQCEELGKQDGECEEGGICGKDTDGAVRCLRICFENDQCPPGTECNGVEGTNYKGCRIKK
jgi:hypothetical protein